jgi:hypothetical protein
MKCPIDQTDLQMMERRGVEIDYCTILMIMTLAAAVKDFSVICLIFD